jgi:hypothetical protein
MRCSLYEEYLVAPFHFGCYNQVFIPGEASISSSSVGSSMAIFSADLLADEHIIDQVTIVLSYQPSFCMILGIHSGFRFSPGFSISSK